MWLMYKFGNEQQVVFFRYRSFFKKMLFLLHSWNCYSQQQHTAILIYISRKTTNAQRFPLLIRPWHLLLIRQKRLCFCYFPAYVKIDKMLLLLYIVIVWLNKVSTLPKLFELICKNWKKYQSNPLIKWTRRELQNYEPVSNAWE